MKALSIDSNKLLVFIVLYFFVFYYPFVFRYISPNIYFILFFLVFVFIFLLFVERKVVLRRDEWLKNSIFVVLVLKGLLGSIVALSFARSYSVIVFDLIRLLSIITIVLFLNKRGFVSADRIVRNITLILSTWASLGFLLSLNGIQFSYSDLTIDTSGGVDDGVRALSIFGFHWMKLEGVGFDAYRMQSFTSEAGNLGVALGPVLLYYLLGQEKVRVFSFLFGFLLICLTLSLSAIASITLIVTLVSGFRKTKAMMSGFLVAVGFLFVLVLFWEFQDVLRPYLESKFLSSKSGFSSGEIRLQQIKGIFDYNQCFYVGCGPDSPGYLAQTVSIGWLVGFLNSGLIIHSLFFSLFLFIFYQSVKGLVLARNGFLRYSSGVLVFFFLQGFFRGEPFITPWQYIYLIPIFSESFYRGAKKNYGRSTAY